MGQNHPRSRPSPPPPPPTLPASTTPLFNILLALALAREGKRFNHSLLFFLFLDSQNFPFFLFYQFSSFSRQFSYTRALLFSSFFRCFSFLVPVFFVFVRSLVSIGLGGSKSYGMNWATTIYLLRDQNEGKRA